MTTTLQPAETHSPEVRDLLLNRWASAVIAAANELRDVRVVYGRRDSGVPVLASYQRESLAAAVRECQWWLEWNGNSDG